MSNTASAARSDRPPSPRSIWSIVLLVSAGGAFEFYDLFFTGYVAPGMIRSGLFEPASLGFFGSLGPIGVAGFGTFVFATFAGLWCGVVALGTAADRFGRRPLYLGALVWYAVSTAVMAFQQSGEMIDLWRFIAGVGFGVQLVTIDTYLSEIVPARLRGRAFAVNQVVSFAAVPLVALLAWLLVPLRVFGLDGWRIVVLIGSAGAGVAGLAAIRLPESPRWLALRGQAVEAEPARLFDRHNRTRTLMMSVFNAAQAIAFYGFNAWLPSLLIARGISVTHSLEYSFLIAIAQPLGPALGISFADRFERRSQILAALVVMGGAMSVFAHLSSPAALIGVGVVFTLAANVMSYAYHNYQAELFPTAIRARAVGFVYSWSRLAVAFGGLAIGYLLRTGGTAAVTAFVAGAITVAFVVIGAFGPRTKDLGLEAIDRGQ